MFKIAEITQHKNIMKALRLQGAYGKEPFDQRPNSNQSNLNPQISQLKQKKNN